MKKVTIREIEQQLNDMIENFCAKDFKKHAFEELDKVEKGGFICPHCAFIIEQYPDFNSILFRCEQPNQFVISININPDSLKGNKKAIRKTAKMLKNWFRRGHEKGEKK